MTSLRSVLEAREARWKVRTEMAKAWKSSVLSLSMVVPGSRKNAPALKKAIYIMAESVEAIAPLKEKKVIEGADGISIHWISPLSPDELKDISIDLENRHPLGRIVDLDVMDRFCNQLSRTEKKLPLRKCLICDRPARLCSSERLHSVDELIGALERILRSSGCLMEGERLFEG